MASMHSAFALKRIVIVVYSFVLLSCSSFIINGGQRSVFSRYRLRSDINDGNSIQVEAEKSIQDEIREIVQMFVQADGGISSISPAVLIENAHILTKGKLYEYVIEKTIEECDNVREIAKIEAVDAFMKGFIVSERKQRSRLKMNYMMSGASSNRLEEAISLLSERFVSSAMSRLIFGIQLITGLGAVTAIYCFFWTTAIKIL
jgi:hypothetical protein